MPLYEDIVVMKMTYPVGYWLYKFRCLMRVNSSTGLLGDWWTNISPVTLIFLALL